MPRKPRRKPLVWLWRLLTVWMCSAHPLAGRGVDALVRDVERRRDGRIAAVGVGDEQRIRGEDRLQHVLHAVCVQRRQGMAEGLVRRGRRRPGSAPARARGRASWRLAHAPAQACAPASAPPSGSQGRCVSSASTIPASRSGAWRSADSLIVSPVPSEAPKASQRSLWCSPDSAAPVSAPNVFPHSLHRNRRRPRALPRDTAPPAGPTEPPRPPCAAPPSTHRHARTSPETDRDPSL